MDYTELTSELLQQMHKLRKFQPHRNVSESLRGEMFIIQFLSQKTEPAIPSEISDIMGISSARIAATLNSLESKGMVSRNIDSGDRRKILVNLTEYGKSFAEEHRKMIFKDMENILMYLGKDDAKEFIRILKRLAEMPESII